MKLDLGFSGNGVRSDKKPQSNTKVLVKLADGTTFIIFCNDPDKKGMTPTIEVGNWLQVVNGEHVADGKYTLRYPYAELEVEKDQIKSFKIIKSKT